ncbi:MAG: tail fiber domain-containing protein [Bacteroidales bacterium]|nr:tail fiber domain-containing protein [Bacteroidales bacterium]
MNKINIVLVTLFISTVAIAQPPQAFKYQAVVRNASGDIVSNQVVGLRISIRNNDVAGPINYQETHSVTTNEYGLITLNIGMGTPVGTFDFQTIIWEHYSKFLEVEVDPLGGTNYISMGVSELLSVPYSLFSGSSADGYWGKVNDNINYGFGNVGIGYTNPLEKLEVYGGAKFRANGGGILITTGTDYGTLEYVESGGSFSNISLRSGMTSLNGYVGIGTSTPGYPLEIISPGTGDILNIYNQNDAPLVRIREDFDGSATLVLNNNAYSPKIMLAAGGNSWINGGSLGLGSTAPTNARLQLEGTGAYDAIIKLNNIGTNGTHFFMGSTNSAWGGGVNQDLFIMGHGAPASANIDVAINESGQVGIATTAPTQTLDVNGGGRFRSLTTGTVYNGVYQTSDGTLVTGSSDIRLKENIEPLQRSLEKVKQLQGVSFTWKDSPEQGQSIGFIAQEFEKVIPELVFTNQTDGYKGINYAEVAAILVEAIKEQQKIIETLQNRIELLEEYNPNN